MKIIGVVMLSILTLSHPLLAQEDKKEAIFTSEQEKEYYLGSVYQYSPAMRAGDYVYVSGVIAGRRAHDAGKVFTIERYEVNIKSAFDDIQSRLKAAGGSTEDIIHMRTFHMFGSDILPMSNQDHIQAVARVKSQYISEPFNSWTAVGTTGLFSPNGLVEIEVVAYMPKPKP